VVTALVQEVTRWWVGGIAIIVMRFSAILLARPRTRSNARAVNSRKWAKRTNLCDDCGLVDGKRRVLGHIIV
jgi:hypothetical protein